MIIKKKEREKKRKEKKIIFPGNFLSGVVYFPVISPPAVFISLLFSLTTAAVVSSYYIMTKW